MLEMGDPDLCGDEEIVPIVSLNRFRDQRFSVIHFSRIDEVDAQVDASLKGGNFVVSVLPLAEDVGPHYPWSVVVCTHANGGDLHFCFSKLTVFRFRHAPDCCDV